MANVVITGWKVGARKVSLTLLIRDRAGVGIREAHHVVRRILDGGRVVLPFDDVESASPFAQDACDLGLDAAVLLDEKGHEPDGEVNGAASFVHEGQA